MLLPSTVAFSWVPMRAVESEAVGLGNSLVTISCAEAVSMPVFAASKSQFRRKAISFAFESDRRRAESEFAESVVCARTTPPAENISSNAVISKAKSRFKLHRNIGIAHIFHPAYPA